MRRTAQSREDGALKPRVVVVAIAAVVALAAGLVPRSDAAPVSGSRPSQSIPTLRVALQVASLSTLDPARTTSAYLITRLGLEPLITLNPDGTLKSHLAQFRQSGPLRYEFTVRKNVKFWDGAELTSADVANALNYYRYPKLGTAGAFRIVRDVKAIGRYTVVVTMKRRAANFPSSLATFGIFQKKFAEAHPGTMGQPGVLMVGTGPWRFDSLDPTRGAELSANPNYWGGPVRIRHISFRFIPDLTNQALAVRAGEIDVVPQFLADVKAFEATSGTKVRLAPSCGVAMMSMNVARAPWNDVHVRRAVAYAINRADVIKAAGVPASQNFTLIPPIQLRSLSSNRAVKNLLKSLPQYRFNLAKARQELSMSAYPNGFTEEFPTYPALANAQQAMVSNLEKIGIKLTLKNLSFNAWIAYAFGPRDKVGLFYFSGLCSTPDPNNWVAYVDSKNVPSVNVATYRNAAVDELIADGVRTADPAKRFAVYGDLLKITGRDVPWLPIMSTYVVTGLSSQLAWPTLQPWTYQGPWALGIRPK